MLRATRYAHNSITLALPKSVKRRIHKVIRTGLKTRALVGGALGVGFLVAILESLCTGQVYLPTIVFVTRAPASQSAGLWRSSANSSPMPPHSTP